MFNDFQQTWYIRPLKYFNTWYHLAGLNFWGMSRAQNLETYAFWGLRWYHFGKLRSDQIGNLVPLIVGLDFWGMSAARAQFYKSANWLIRRNREPKEKKQKKALAAASKCNVPLRSTLRVFTALPVIRHRALHESVLSPLGLISANMELDF